MNECKCNFQIHLLHLLSIFVNLSGKKLGKYKDLSDLDLLKKISEYDIRAFEELYERYSVLLYTLIKKISPDIKTSEMILVEVFTILWRKIEFFDLESGNVYGWLINLARNRAIDSLRRNRLSSDDIENYNDDYENNYILPVLDKTIDPLDLDTASAIKDDIEGALDKLTDAQKYVIHLSYYEGYTINEIAEKLNIPLETVRGKIMTALHNLRDNLVGKE